MGGLDDDMRRRARSLLERAGLGELLAEAELTPVEGGSDRTFARIRRGSASVMVLFQDPGWEIDSYIEIGRFLRRNGVGAPEIIACDRDRGLVLMEDLGDRHLEEVLAGAPEGEIARRYRNALDLLVLMQTSVTEAMTRERFLAGRIFDEGVLLGETDYFVREFIEGFCPVPLPAAWEEERRLIAAKLAAEPAVFMHRDFQSRNIMVKEGALRIIDFQTAHRGPGLYDAASLLKDAYHPLPAPLVRSLVEEFHVMLQERGSRRGERFETFYETFVLAGIQRNLQALAAFAKLGLRKGKRKFLESIPRGIDLLDGGVREHGRLPGLARLTAAIRERLT